MSHFSECDWTLSGDSKRLEGEAAAEVKLRESTLAALGINPLVPYDFALTDIERSDKRKPPRGNSRMTPRKVARAAGLRFYISGRACPAGHTVERRVSNGGCPLCDSEWTDCHRDRRKAFWRESKQRGRDRAKLDATLHTDLT